MLVVLIVYKAQAFKAVLDKKGRVVVTNGGKTTLATGTWRCNYVCYDDNTKLKANWRALDKLDDAIRKKVAEEAPQLWGKDMKEGGPINAHGSSTLLAKLQFPED